jgi:uncharacterized membrane protein YfcA
MDLLNPLAGFIVGLLVGFTGVGAGALMTPLLVLVFGVAPQTAVGTDLLFASITKGVGVWVHGSRGSIDWGVLRRLCAGSLPAATLTLLLLHYFPVNRELGSIIMPGLGVALVLRVWRRYQVKLHRLGQQLRTHSTGKVHGAQPIPRCRGAPWASWYADIQVPALSAW